MSILVIGGSNIDYLAKSFSPLIPQDSNIGTLHISHGGVGRNVVENLAHLKTQGLTFLTAIGSDTLGQNMKQELLDLGVNVLSPDTHLTSASYIAIQSPDGDMALAISDMQIMDSLTAEWIKQKQNYFDNSELLIFDANLSKETLSFLFSQNPNRPICMDAISVKKAERIIPFLNQLTLFKGNLIEGKHLTGLVEPEDIVKALLEKGTQNVVISTGSGPIYYGYKDNNNYIINHEDTIKADNIVSTTGCGDSLFSGIVYSLSLHKTLQEGILLGRKMSYHTLSTSSAVASDIKEWLDQCSFK